MRHACDLDGKVSQLRALEKNSCGSFCWHREVDETDTATAFIPAKIDFTDFAATLKQLSHGFEI